MRAMEPQPRKWCRAQKVETSRWGAELAVANFADAYTQFPVARKELQQCLSPTGSSSAKVKTGPLQEAAFQFGLHR